MITSEQEEAVKFSTVKASLSILEINALNDSVIYKIDIPVNWYDLLCIEGLTSGLEIFLGNMDAPTNKVIAIPNANMEVMTVQPVMLQIRPFVVCAILRNVKFKEQCYNSFIELQVQLV